MNNLVLKNANGMEFVPAPREFKATEADLEKGTFSGYGAVFGNRDDGFDVIEKGAFKKFRKKSNGRIRIMAYHDSRKIIGDAKVTQDDNGLFVEGQLNFKLPETEGIFELMKDGALDAMSVGFNILPKGAKWDDESMTRFISKAELWETSIVPFGMNSKARITNVKGAEIQSPAQFEEFLRSSGFSRKQAVAIASRGFVAGQSDSVLDTRATLDLKNLLIADTHF